MSENKIRGGALLARALKDKGISKVFTLSGVNPILFSWGFISLGTPIFIEKINSFYFYYS